MLSLNVTRRASVQGAGRISMSGHMLPCRQALGRRVYRLLKRALSFWPEQRPVEPVFTLWVALLAPWVVPESPGALSCHTLLHPFSCRNLLDLAVNTRPASLHRL